MNVALAFQLFSSSAANGMQIYKNDHPWLKDCDSTIIFVERMNALIDIMNSCTPLTAFKDGTNQKQECGYTYFMTSRMNQDSLERFFGIIRNACGSNTHPDPLHFAQMYRLMSVYLLV